MLRVGFLTSGGDCQALNATMRGIAKGLYELFDEVEIYGFLEGYKGLIRGNYIKMKPADFSGIINKGGTILGSSRQPFKLMGEPTEDGLDKVKSMKDTYKKLKLDCLCVLGGNGSQKAPSHTNSSNNKPVREPARTNENVNGTENNGSSENERTTVSYGSKTQSAGAKAGKRVGMVMDSGKRLKDRMNLAKENVKNTPTEIKYQAGLHRKAMEQNVKDFKEGIAGERNRRETGRLQERNRIRADAGKKRREMYLAKRRNETALKRYDGIDFHQRIPVNGKELDKYRGVDGLNRSAKAGKSFIDSRGQMRKASDEKLRDMAGSEERIRKNDQKTERIGTPLEEIRYKQSITRLPYLDKDVRKELGTYGTMLNSTDQEKFMKGLEQQRAGNKGLQEKNAGQDLRGAKPESVPGKTVIRSSRNAKDLRNDVLAEQRKTGSADRRTDRRK